MKKPSKVRNFFNYILLELLGVLIGLAIRGSKVASS